MTIKLRAVVEEGKPFSESDDRRRRRRCRRDEVAAVAAAAIAGERTHYEEGCQGRE
jgi:hypothetical protein